MASLVFSLAVFFELVEQPFEILDAELEAEAQRIVRTVVARQKESGKMHSDPAANEIYAHWLKVFEQDSGKLIYQSGLTKSVDLPLLTPGASKTVGLSIPPGSPPMGRKTAVKRPSGSEALQLI